jgi:hypothetical protein
MADEDGRPGQDGAELGGGDGQVIGPKLAGLSSA